MGDNMTAPTPEASPTEAAQPETEAPPADTTDWKAEARKWEARAKEHGAAAKEFEKQRQATMTEAEKAVAEAEGKGRQSAMQEYGKRLARSEFDAAAARRNPDADTAAVLEFVDLGRFVGEDGEPDPKAIKAAVERLVPAPLSGPPSFDGGTRQTPSPTAGMNDFIRQAAGRT